MIRRFFSLVALSVILLSPRFAVSEQRTADPTSAQGIVLFDEQIRPVLVKHCFECHSKSGEDIAGGLELDSPAGLLRGGDSGPILVAHDVEKSALIHMLHHDEGVSAMPPEHKLADEVLGRV